MTRRNQFALIIVSAIALASVISHAAARFSGIDTSFKPGSFLPGAQYHAQPGLYAGSSTIGAAIDWSAVAEDVSRPMVGATAASASPCELDILARRYPDVAFTVIGVSIYELDEDIISDMRADIVPFHQTVNDLWASRADWPFVKRTLSRYPLECLQWVFPSAGRAMGIMVGVRARLRQLAHLAARQNEEPVLNLQGTIAVNSRIVDWPEGRVLRNLSEMRALAHNEHSFNGPKHLAFARLLKFASSHGKVMVVVLPVSPEYRKGLLAPALIDSYEKSLVDLSTREPEVVWMRMDQIPQLQDSANFADLVHVNQYGREIATAAFRKELAAVLHAP